MLNYFPKVLNLHAVLIRSNLTESKPRLNPRFRFGVYSGFTLRLLEWTHSKPQVNPE